MIVLAHRGASKAAPENTLLAFRLGFAMGAHGVEFDTYQIGDDIVVFHDRWLHRTTNGRGRVADQTTDYLRSLDAGQGERIPFLAETLATLPEDALCNVEIKGLTDTARWLSAFDRACEESGASTDSMVISSFNHQWLAEISRARPDLKTGALTASIHTGLLQFADSLKPWSLHIALDIVEERYVSRAKAEGYKVFVYTVDNPEDMLLLQQWGVDGIFSNVPDVACETLNATQRMC